jgi:hypothetical protein
MRFALTLLLAVLVAGPIKLVLKDGTYQMVRSYERAGDRVKFYSIERNEWEEMPADLVDWKATEETTKREKEEDAAKAREIDQQEKKDADEDRVALDGKEIAPGVRLGEDYGFYAVSGGKVTPLPVARAGTATDKRRVAANILLPAPVLKNRRLVTLPGAKAATRFPKQPDGLYVVSDNKAARYMLLRVKVKGDHRELEAISTSAFGGKAEHNGDEIEMVEVEIGKETLRLAPRVSLLPGEYALVEIVDDKLNLYVADFGVGT